MRANLRVCSRCEWIWKMPPDNTGDYSCPVCGFGSYGAFYVYGKKAYKYMKTQDPWKQRKMGKYARLLNKQVKKLHEREAK